MMKTEAFCRVGEYDLINVEAGFRVSANNCNGTEAILLASKPHGWRFDLRAAAARKKFSKAV